MPKQIAVIDVGSFTVRMVVYQCDKRRGRFLSVDNLKAECALINGLLPNGNLSLLAIKRVLRAVKRFKTYLDEHPGVSEVHVLATAAVREAQNGAFVAEAIENTLGVSVQILSASEEARFSAYAVLAYDEHAEGLVGDLGGGSLEFAQLEDAHVMESISLKLGHLRLAEKLKSQLPVQVVDKLIWHFKRLHWLYKTQQHFTFYAIGGRWRDLAKLYAKSQKREKHVDEPYKVITIETKYLKKWLDKKILDTKKTELGKQPRPVFAAALALKAVLFLVKPEQVVFMPSGVREGYLWHYLKLNH